MSIDRRRALALLLAAANLPAARPAPAAPSILIEAESFDWPGGWALDQQHMDQMGSAYLLAHGMGVPVEDARTTVQVPAAGKYRIWVRTRDWVAPWKPGRFQLLLNGQPMPATLGTEGADWHWQDGGTAPLRSGPLAVALHDLTGFDGRCDAIFLTADDALRPPDAGPELAAFRRRELRLPAAPALAGDFDLVVIGGGMAGTAAAISAARRGLRVALLQDRPLLGGNNSSEIRVALGGELNLPPYPALGAVVRELDPGKPGNAAPAANYGDEKKLAAVRAEKNIRLSLNTRAIGVEKDGNRITAVIARDVHSGAESRYTAPLFADCTGDSGIGFLAGADYRYGRESRAETGEPSAPEQADRLVLGSSLMWYSEDAGRPVAFPDCPWALPFTEASVQHATRGDWDWETGQRQDQVAAAEQIRDHALRAIYGNWAFQKNHSQAKDKYAGLRLAWVAHIAGKRESRRLMGDVILTEQDVVGQRLFPDSAVPATWAIDLHYPAPANTKHFPGQEFRTEARFGKKETFAVPYRCFYSRNIENLFMAGRNISVTHVALGTVRVMRTTGMMGEVVGMAAAVCRRHRTTPRGVYQEHLEELKQLMARGLTTEAAPSPASAPPPAPASTR